MSTVDDIYRAAAILAGLSWHWSDDMGGYYCLRGVDGLGCGYIQRLHNGRWSGVQYGQRVCNRLDPDAAKRVIERLYLTREKGRSVSRGGPS